MIPLILSSLISFATTTEIPKSKPWPPREQVFHEHFWECYSVYIKLSTVEQQTTVPNWHTRFRREIAYCVGERLIPFIATSKEAHLTWLITPTGSIKEAITECLRYRYAVDEEEGMIVEPDFKQRAQRIECCYQEVESNGKKYKR